MAESAALLTHESARRQFADQLRPFAHAQRLMVLALLSRQEMTTTGLSADTGLSSAALRTHLRLLVRAGIVQEGWRGMCKCYQFNGTLMPPLHKLLPALLKPATGDVLPSHADATHNTETNQLSVKPCVL